MTQENWRPITTAPKDGSEMLFWCGLVTPGSVQIGIWFEGIADGGWFDGVVNGRWETLDGVALEGVFHPTHWMPLPEPPA